MAPCNMGLGASRARRSLHTCPVNPLGFRPRDKEVPAVIGVEVLVGMMNMRGPVTPAGAAAKQVAVEGLLVLASPLLSGRSLDLVSSPGLAAKQAIAPAMLPVAELPV